MESGRIWNRERIKSEIFHCMDILGIDRMPSNGELISIGRIDLTGAISKTMNYSGWAKELGIKTKREVETNGYGHVWTEEKVKEEIFNVMNVLMIDRMPTASEMKNLGRMDLHNKISKSKKYSGWAKELGLKTKDSETKTGQQHEEKVTSLLKMMGYEVERMSTKHPYDLLVNGCVKVDVKVGKPHQHFGSRAHTFGINKQNATCDIYLIIALDENKNFEKEFIIPGHHLKLVTLNICKDSKWNEYRGRWDYFKKYIEFYSSI